MDYYDYRDWLEWPESEIRAYARAIADDNSLSLAEAEHMETQMVRKAGYWPAVANAKARPNSSLGKSRYAREERWLSFGNGLTKKVARRVIRQSAASKKEGQRARKKFAANPIPHLKMRVVDMVVEAKWASNSYPIDHGRWLVTSQYDSPFESLDWYGRELLAAFSNAQAQADKGNNQFALYHAFRAGELHAELAVRLAHGEVYEKFQAVSTAQSDAAKARKSISDDLRRETYWKHRQEGNKRVESGRLAAAELGLSEPSIRNAFPGGRYPDE
jgi:hypothetical protein